MCLKKIIVLIAIGSLIWCMGGCDRQGENIPTGAPTLASHNASGWQFYENGQFEEALEEFNEANDRDVTDPEAYLGSGYCNAQLGMFVNAITNFDFVLTLAEEGSPIIVDAIAGKAAASLGAGNDSMAVFYGEEVIDLAGSDYIFSHDPSFGSSDILLIVAQAHFNMKRFPEAVEQVEKLTPGFLDGDDMSSVQYTESANATVTEVDALTGSVVLSTEHPVVRLIRVRKDKDYYIEVIGYGTTSVEVYGNPVPNVGDLFLIDYYYAADYGLFISQLMGKIDELKNTT